MYTATTPRCERYIHTSDTQHRKTKVGLSRVLWSPMMSSYYKRASTHLIYTCVTHNERLVVCTWPPHPAVNDIFTPRTLNIPKIKVKFDAYMSISMSSYYKRASTHLISTFETSNERIIVCTWTPHPAVNDIFTPRTLNIPG